MNYVTDEDVRQILGYGLERYPHEACGVLVLGRPQGSRRLRELPNRADTPEDEVLMTSEDITRTLEGMGALVGGLEVVFWHTHPGGNVGPSRMDMRFKREQLGNARCLVVTVPTGEAVQF